MYKILLETLTWRCTIIFFLEISSTTEFSLIASVVPSSPGAVSTVDAASVD